MLKRLHTKILKDNFAKKVSEEEILALAEAPDIMDQLQLEIANLSVENLILKDFINGEWIDTENIKTALNIDFTRGMELFDFCREAEWNLPPLNGQKITTKFRMSHNKAIQETIDKIRKKLLACELIYVEEQNWCARNTIQQVLDIIDLVMQEQIKGEENNND